MKQLAEKLQISSITLSRWVRMDHVPYYRINGRDVRFKETEMNEWLEKQFKRPANYTVPEKKTEADG